MLEKASNAKKNSDAFYVWKCQKLCRPILSMASPLAPLHKSSSDSLSAESA